MSLARGPNSQTSRNPSSDLHTLIILYDTQMWAEAAPTVPCAERFSVILNFDGLERGWTRGSTAVLRP